MRFALKDLFKTLHNRILCENYKYFLKIKFFGENQIALKLKVEAVWQYLHSKVGNLVKIKEIQITNLFQKKFYKWHSFTKVSKELKFLIMDLEGEKTKEMEVLIKNKTNESQKLKAKEGEIQKLFDSKKEEEQVLLSRLKDLKIQENDAKLQNEKFEVKNYILDK